MSLSLPVERAEPEPDRSLKRASVIDADEYQLALRGVVATAVRIGYGHESNDVTGVEDEHMAVTSCHIGFPVATSTHVPESASALVHFRSAAPGMRWEGMDVREGMALEYGPGARHAGVDLEGSCFTYTVVELAALEQQADQLGVPFRAPVRGGIRDASEVAEFDTAAELMRSISSLREGSVPPRHLMDDLRTALVLGRVRLRHDRPPRSRTHLGSGRVIRRCLEYAASIGRRPSVSELCVVAGVGERRLREVFVSTFDLPPSVFFRAWALNRAHDRLASGDQIPGGVSDVALETGFGHFGRFAHYYRDMFGEYPSDTYRLYAPSRPRALS